MYSLVKMDQDTIQTRKKKESNNENYTVHWVALLQHLVNLLLYICDMKINN